MLNTLFAIFESLWLKSNLSLSKFDKNVWGNSYKLKSKFEE